MGELPSLHDDFASLLEEHMPMLRRLTAYRLPANAAADAEDVLQEICLAAYRKRDTLRSRESFRPWICQIARNRINDYYRAAGQAESFRAAAKSRRYAACSPVPSPGGNPVRALVRETLASLSPPDRQILTLFYLEEYPLSEIAVMLKIPQGTVKSRLYHARNHFRDRYPYGPKTKGENIMKTLPEILPAYTIEPMAEPPFPVVFEELPGWFIIPREGESVVWGSYDMPHRKLTETVCSRVTGKIRIHDVEGVEIETVFADRTAADGRSSHLYYAQLTDTHCRWLGECYTGRDGVKRILTFLDGDDFYDEWGIGEDNCGAPTHLSPAGCILRQGDRVTTVPEKYAGHMAMDVTGRYKVTLDGREHDTVLWMTVTTQEGYNVATEQYIGRDGHTVLWRRFNRDDWHYEGIARDGRRWTELLPESERLMIDGQTFVHWYDSVTTASGTL